MRKLSAQVNGKSKSTRRSNRMNPLARFVPLWDSSPVRGEDAKRQGLSFGHGLVGRGAIDEDPGNFWDLREPAPVVFALVFNVEIHLASGPEESIGRAAPREQKGPCSTRSPSPAA